MSVHSLIFSSTPANRAKRHLAFWLVYGFYFFVQSVTPNEIDGFKTLNTYANALLSVACFIPVCVMCVYVSIYFVLPRFLYTRRYIKAVIAFLLLYTAGFVVNYFTAIYFLSGIKGNFPLYTIAVTLGYLNTIWAMIISGLAIGIKTSKDWYVQQKAILEITSQKTRTELHFQKDRIQPRFLYSILDSIYSKINAQGGEASSMILILSNLLSYSLYETQAESVPIEKEVAAIKDFISLEKIKNTHTINLDFPAANHPHDFLITPMIILSVLQNSVVMLKDSNARRCPIDIHIDVLKQHATIIFSKIDEEIMKYIEWNKIVYQENKRLTGIADSNAGKISHYDNPKSMSVTVYIPLFNYKNTAETVKKESIYEFA